MDPYLIAVAARSAERIIGVLLGGLAIYYGFRLFLVVPVQTRGDGKIELPGVSVVLAKAGPGLFFAAFGVIVVITSLINAVKFDDGVMAYQGVAEAASMGTSQQRAVPLPQSAPTPQDMARVRLAIQTLNCLHQLSATDRRTISANDVDLAVRDAKLALLSGVWHKAEWGDIELFRLWAAGGVGKTGSPAKAVFEAERADCPH